MKWTNKSHQFDQFAKDWNAECVYYLWGASSTGERFLKRFQDNLNIEGFFDSNSQKIGQVFHGFQIYSFADRLSLDKNRKIIVTSGAYWEIRVILLKAGLVENIDFCNSILFTSVYQMYHHNRLFLPRVDVAVTDKCTFNCRDCNMAMPFFENPQHRQLEELKADLDLYFQWVDNLDRLDLLGGEPFLYNELAGLLEFLGMHYRHRIDKIIFFTNATVIPTPEVLGLCRDYHVSIQISDYSSVLPVCKGKIETLLDQIRKYNISYTLLTMENWVDFSLMNRVKADYTEEQMIAFCDLCAPPFRGLRQRKLYYCHLSCSASKAGIYWDDKNEYFDLNQPDSERKKELLEFDAGYSELGYMPFCRYCHGCNSVNDRVIPGAIQVSRHKK